MTITLCNKSNRFRSLDTGRFVSAEYAARYMVAMMQSMIQAPKHNDVKSEGHALRGYSKPMAINTPAVERDMDAARALGILKRKHHHEA